MSEATRYTSENYEWILSHLWDDIVDKYGGEYVAVADQKVVSHGPSRVSVEEEARRIHPNKDIDVLPVPRRDDLVHILSAVRL